MREIDIKDLDGDGDEKEPFTDAMRLAWFEALKKNDNGGVAVLDEDGQLPDSAMASRVPSGVLLEEAPVSTRPAGFYFGGDTVFSPDLPSDLADLFYEPFIQIEDSFDGFPQFTTYGRYYGQEPFLLIGSIAEAGPQRFLFMRGYVPGYNYDMLRTGNISSNFIPTNSAWSSWTYVSGDVYCIEKEAEAGTPLTIGQMFQVMSKMGFKGPDGRAVYFPFLDHNFKIPARFFPNVIQSELRTGSTEELDNAIPPIKFNEPVFDSTKNALRVGAQYPGLLQSDPNTFTVYPTSTFESSALVVRAAVDAACARVLELLAGGDTTTGVKVIVYPGRYLFVGDPLIITTNRVSIVGMLPAFMDKGNNQMPKVIFQNNGQYVIRDSGVSSTKSFFANLDTRGGTISAFQNLSQNVCMENMAINTGPGAKCMPDGAYYGSFKRCEFGNGALGGGTGNINNLFGGTAIECITGTNAYGYALLASAIVERCTANSLPYCEGKIRYCTVAQTIGARGGTGKVKWSTANNADVHDV